MKKKSILFLGCVLCFYLIPKINLYSQAEAGAGEPATPHLGIIFNVASLLMSIADYNDGVQGGAGLKLWLNDNMAVRGLFDFYYLNDSTPGVSSEMTIGAAADFEYHFIRAKISPYGGGLAGFQIITGPANNLALYFGAIFGAEMELLENLSLFGEYNLLLKIDEPQLEIDLEIGNNAQIGLIIYIL